MDIKKLFQKQVLFGALSAVLLQAMPMAASADEPPQTPSQELMDKTFNDPSIPFLSPDMSDEEEQALLDETLAKMDALLDKEALIAQDIEWSDLNRLARGPWTAEKRDQLEILLNKQIALDPDMKDRALFIMPGNTMTFDLKKTWAMFEVDRIFPDVGKDGNVSISDASIIIENLGTSVTDVLKSDNGHEVKFIVGFDDLISDYRNRNLTDNIDYLHDIDRSFLQVFIAVHEYVHGTGFDAMESPFKDLYQSMSDRLSNEEKADFLAAAIITSVIDDKDYVRAQLENIAELRTLLGLNLAIEHTHKPNAYDMALANDHNTVSGLLAITENWDDFQKIAKTAFPDEGSIKAASIQANMQPINDWIDQHNLTPSGTEQDNTYAIYRGFIDAKNYILYGDKDAIMHDNPYFHQYINHYIDARDERGNSPMDLKEKYASDFTTTAPMPGHQAKPTALTLSDQP